MALRYTSAIIGVSASTATIGRQCRKAKLHSLRPKVKRYLWSFNVQYDAFRREVVYQICQLSQVRPMVGKPAIASGNEHVPSPYASSSDGRAHRLHKTLHSRRNATHFLLFGVAAQYIASKQRSSERARRLFFTPDPLANGSSISAVASLS